MKLVLEKKMIVMALVMTLGLPTMEAQNQTLEVNLDKALEIALSESPTIKIADHELVRVDYSKKAAWFGLLPTVDGTAQYGKYLSPATMALAGMVIDLPTDWTASVGLQLSLPLVAPALWKSIQMSHLDMQLAVEKARASKITLRNDVTKAYYSILLAQDSYKVLQDGYALAEENYKQAKKRFEAGVVAEYDCVSAEVQMTNLQPNLLQVENGIEQAKLYLKVLMGVEMSVELLVQGSLADFENDVFGLNANRDIELSNNTDLKQLDIQYLQTKKALGIQQTQWMPTLAAFGQYTYAGQSDKEAVSLFNREAGVQPAHTEWFGQGFIVGLQLSVPILHVTNYHKDRQLKIQAQELQIQRDYAENQLTVAALTSRDNMNKATKQMDAAKKAVTLSQKAYEISAKRYETGMGTMLELQNAAVAMTQSNLSYQQAISDYLTAKADLDKTLGL
ncbi:transporter [Bacteroidia bacterium]|nr:transporter [Bacteroidia bacterium]